MEHAFSLGASSSGKHLWISSSHLACRKRNRPFLRDAPLVDWRLLYIVMNFVVFCLRMKDVIENPTMRYVFHDVFILHGLRKSLHKDCIARKEPAECLFPKEIIKNIATPVFLLHSAYDFWQIQNILIPEGSDPYHYWQKCRLDIHNCNTTQVEILQGYRRSLLKALKEFQKNKEGGMFISSCFIHCQAWMTETWHAPTSPRINNKTIAESVGDWYFNRNASKKIDCPFLCNPTCYHVNFTHG